MTDKYDAFYGVNDIVYGDIIEVAWDDSPNSFGIVSDIRYNDTTKDDEGILALRYLTLHGEQDCEAGQVVRVHENALVALGVQ